MGTHVHGIFQAKVEGRWVDVPRRSDDPGRYVLDVILYGDEWRETWETLGQPRGLPPDFVVGKGDRHRVQCPQALNAWDLEGTLFLHEGEIGPPDIHFWIGDYPPGWWSSDEMLAWFRRAGADGGPFQGPFDWPILEFFTEVRRLHEEHGGVRFVFGRI